MYIVSYKNGFGEKNLKIAIIHPYFNILGGAERTTLSLIKKVIETKNEIILYCVEPPKINGLTNVKIVKINKKSFSLFRGFQRLKEIDEIFDKIQDEELILIMSGGLAIPKEIERKVFLYCNSSFDEEEKLLNKKFQGIKGKYYKKIQNEITNRLEILKQTNVQLIANSNYTKNKMLEKFGKSSKIVYPPVNTEHFSKFFNMPKESRVITISRFSPEKNIGFAIDVMNSVDIPYELIGNAGNKKQLKIFNDIELKAKSSIHLHKNLSLDKIDEILSNSKVYFHPSNETFGIAVIEAILAGCIPIVPNSSAHKETVPFDSLRFSNKEDAVKKIELALKGEFDQLREKLYDNAIQFSEERFQEDFMKQIIN